LTWSNRCLSTIQRGGAQLTRQQFQSDLVRIAPLPRIDRPRGIGKHLLLLLRSGGRNGTGSVAVIVGARVVREVRIVRRRYVVIGIPRARPGLAGLRRTGISGSRTGRAGLTGPGKPGRRGPPPGRTRRPVRPGLPVTGSGRRRSPGTGGLRIASGSGFPAAGIAVTGTGPAGPR